MSKPFLQHLIGIDLGGTKIETAVFDSNLQAIWKKRIATPQNYQECLAAICSQITLAKEQCSLENDHPVGMATPGSPNPNTQIIRNANSVWLNDMPLQADLEKQAKCQFRLANDANCFALAEAQYGAGKSYGSVFGVIIGTGCGGGFVLNNSLVSGSNGNAAEWGHNPYLDHLAKYSEPVQCWCGRYNCVETWLSGPGFFHRYQLAGGTASSAEEICQRASAGQSQEQTAIRQYVNWMAGALGPVINLIDIEIVILGGGLSNMPSLAPMVQKQIYPHIFSDHPKVSITPNQLGDSSGVLGAALLWGQDG